MTFKAVLPKMFFRISAIAPVATSGGNIVLYELVSYCPFFEELISLLREEHPHASQLIKLMKSP